MDDPITLLSLFRAYVRPLIKKLTDFWEHDVINGRPIRMVTLIDLLDWRFVVFSDELGSIPADEENFAVISGNKNEQS